MKFFIIFFFFTINAFADNISDKSQSVATKLISLEFSLGNLCEYIGKIQIDENGKKNFCQFNPIFYSTFKSELIKEINWALDAGITLPEKGRDQNITKFSFFLLYNLQYQYSFITFESGLGFYFISISGNGGVEDLNNGDGNSSFPLPSENHISSNLVTNIGTKFTINNDWSTSLKFLFFNILNSSSRTLSVIFSLNYNYGELK